MLSRRRKYFTVTVMNQNEDEEVAT